MPDTIMKEKMSGTRPNIAWCLFSLIVWAHFMPYVYPLPSRQSPDIRIAAKELVANAKAIDQRGVKDKSTSGMTEEDWVDALTMMQWRSWIYGMLILIAGLLSTYLMYKGKKSWPLYIGAISLIMCFRTIPGALKTAVYFGSLGHVVHFITNVANGKPLVALYKIMVVPVYFVALMFIASLTLLRKKTG